MIRRIAFFCLTWLFLTMAGLFYAGEVQAFFFNSKKKEVTGGTVAPGTIQESDADTLRETIEEAKNLAATGNFDQAIEIYTNAINRNPQDPVLYFERGNLNYYKMIMGPSEKLKTVISPSAVSVDSQPEAKLTPDMPPLTGSGEPCALALADFNQAIALNPNYGIFYYMRGVLLATDSCSHGNLERAVADYDQAIRLSPSNAAYYQERGNARLKLKQYGQAINDIDRAILIEPINYYFYYEKGLAQEQMGRSEDAADSIKRALELAPPDQMGPFIAALERVRNGIRRTLIADYTSLIAKRPTVSSFYIQRGLLYGDEKRFTSAVGDLSTALSFQSDDRDLYFTRGKIFYAAGKNRNSLKDFQTACRLKQPAACHYVQLLEKEVNRGDRWVPFWYSRNNRKYFYDRQHLKTQGGSFKVARVRIEADDSGIENPAGMDNTVPGKERGDYRLETWEFNCPGAQIRISTGKRFDRDGRIIAPQPDLEKAFRPVFPGGFSEKLYRIVCRQGENKGASKKQVILE